MLLGVLDLLDFILIFNIVVNYSRLIEGFRHLSQDSVLVYLLYLQFLPLLAHDLVAQWITKSKLCEEVRPFIRISLDQRILQGAIILLILLVRNPAVICPGGDRIVLVIVS